MSSDNYEDHMENLDPDETSELLRRELDEINEEIEEERFLSPEYLKKIEEELQHRINLLERMLAILDKKPEDEESNDNDEPLD